MKLFNTLIAGGLLTLSFLVQFLWQQKLRPFEKKWLKTLLKNGKIFIIHPLLSDSKADTEIRKDTGTAERPLEYAQCNIVNRYWRSVETPLELTFVDYPE
ncbi:MAG UNVERIFIED_CONTAM: hypothetical protein LVR29_03690 [Microcystis novacekii LVE1205-3]|jgi:hypothetical protein